MKHPSISEIPRNDFRFDDDNLRSEVRSGFVRIEGRLGRLESTVDDAVTQLRAEQAKQANRTTMIIGALTTGVPVLIALLRALGVIR